MEHFHHVWMLILFLLCGFVDGGIHEKRLLSHLFNRSRWDAHNSMERPAIAEGKALQVFLKCYLNQIMDMDEKNQVLSTIIWLDMKWTDYHFQWDARDFANIQQINLPPTKVWKPDLILYNSASEKFDQIYPTNVIVRNTGHMSWIPPGLVHSICSVKVNWFPFDSQSCILKFGTWSYQGNTVDLKLQCDNETDYDQPCNHQNQVDLSTYLAHSEWALESALIKRNVDSYGTIDNLYIDVTIYVHIQRRALYYMFNIIVPCMIMSVMAMLVFTLPPDANEKIVLGVTTLLSLTMLLQLVGDKLPQTSAGNPVLVLYFTCTIILCSLSLVFAVVLLNLHHHTGENSNVPWIIEIVINCWLASALRIDRRVGVEPVADADKNNDESVYPTSTIRSPLSKLFTENGHMSGLPVKTNPTQCSNSILDMDTEFRPSLRLTRLVDSHPGTVKQNFYNSAPSSSQENMITASGTFTNSNSRYSHSNGTESSGNSPGYSDSIIQNTHYWNSPMKDAMEPHKSIPTILGNQFAQHESFDTDQQPEGVGETQFTEKALIFNRIKELTREVRYITGRMHRNDNEARTLTEWQLACRVLDRLFLLIFAALNLFTTLGILTSAPTIIKAFTSTGAPSQPM